MLHTEWDHPKQKKRTIVFWTLARSLRAVTHAVTYLSSDGGRNLSISFLDKIILFYFVSISLSVCCGECGCICMISIGVADNQLWLLWLNRAITMNADRMLWTIWPISVWLSSVLPHTSVCIINSYQCECLAIRVCTWVCTSLHTKLFFFLLLKFVLLYFLMVK